MERDRERLKLMTFYCFTNECLRDYILRYFGEYGENYCGNCSNCLSQFENVEVTEIAKVLIGCVKECRQRYGVNVILDTVHGANTAKIRGYHMNENKLYGELKKVPPYIVFSDKTLIHMCRLKPENREEMLMVTGVGEYKYEKYGEQFILLIRQTV